jgi:hypothetical protein
MEPLKDLDKHGYAIIPKVLNEQEVEYAKNCFCD